MLEINPDHPVVARLKQETDASLFADWSQILFDQAVLAEGGELDDPATFVKRLNKLTLALAGGAAIEDLDARGLVWQLPATGSSFTIRRIAASC